VWVGPWSASVPDLDILVLLPLLVRTPLVSGIDRVAKKILLDLGRPVAVEIGGDLLYTAADLHSEKGGG
jgi:hypothetical protein